MTPAPKIAPAPPAPSRPSATPMQPQPSSQRKILPLGDPPPQQPVPSSNLSSAATRQVLRVNRACNACRKQKMRCEGPDNPPCARCRASGQPCIFEKVQKPEVTDTNTQRLTDLETKWAAIESTLGDVLKELKDVKSSLHKPESRPPSSVGLAQQQSGASPSGSSPNDFRSNTYSPRVGTSPPTLPGPIQPPFQPPFATSPNYPSQLPPINQLYNARIESPLNNHRSPTSGIPHSTDGSSHASFPPHRRPTLRTDMPPPTSAAKRRAAAVAANIYSANNSGDEEDLPSAALAAPISVVADIASAHPQSSDSESSASDSEPDVQSPQSPNFKRKRRDSSVTDRSRARFRTQNGDAMDMERGHSNQKDTRSMSSVASTSSQVRSKRRRTRDVVEKGLVSEEDAMQLYQNYFSGCHRLLAVFDPSVDTYASIKERSPFLLCSLLMVGAKVRDGPVCSELQAMLLQEASDYAKERVFESKGCVEDVQAMLLLAGWSHSMGGVGWLTAGHAIRVAVELGIHKALQRLEKISKMDVSDPQSHRPLITAARTWLALYVFEYQISFGTGRPAMMRADRAITRGRDILLNHPLSIPTDARLVSTCELLTRQDAIHKKLQDSLELGDDATVYRTLQEATADIDNWLDEWDAFMGQSQPTAGFFRSSAAIQRAYANLFHNCIALRGVKTVEDAKVLSPEMKAIALQAIQSAKECVQICLNNHEYRVGLKYAVAYTHTCAAFAGAFLLRFARLFPGHVELNETTQMVDALAGVLSEVPAVSFGIWLRKMLTHTRQRITQPQPPLYVLQQHPSEESKAAIGFFSGGPTSGSTNTPNPYPLPPLPLPNSAPFLPVSTTPTTSTFSNDFNNIVHPNYNNGAVNGFGGNGSGFGDVQGGSFTQDSVGNMLQGLLGDGNDWPPWLTTSVVGDLTIDQTMPMSAGPTDLSFAWNPQI